MSVALNALFGYGMLEVVPIIFSNAHGWFYSNLFLTFITFVYFTSFHYVCKQYKLRKRDDIVPIHLLAEEVTEREMKERRKLDAEKALWKKRINVV